jgi:hypothetical protein
MMVIYVLIHNLKEGEELIRCPFCPYFEVRHNDEANPGAIFLYCQRAECHKTSCIICKKNCPSSVDGYVSYQESETHALCGELKEAKLMVDQAVERGIKIPCPTCNVSGMKDDNCTHMTCSNCSEVWCYFCGRKESDCDKADPDGTISSHNEGWEDNIGTRCPMYLSSLSETHGWPEDEDACLELFHNLRARGLLKRAVRALGRPLCDRLDAQFSSFSSCGFSMEEIESADAQWPELCAVIQGVVPDDT